MPYQLDYFNKLVLVTSPDVVATVQGLSDFIEDEMASPVGMLSDGGLTWDFRGDVARPEGKLEDPGNPGVYTQIILSLNPDWQIQFWPGSGYTRIIGGKLIGGLGGQVMKATGTAGDITVLETQVDGTVVVSGSGLSLAQDARLTRLEEFARNERVTNPVTGKQTVMSDAGVPKYQGDLYEDVAETVPYQGDGANVAKRLVDL